MLLRRASGWALTVAAGAVTVWLVLNRFNSNYARMISGDLAWHEDFLTFYRSAVALLRGQSIYGNGGPIPNLNPPFMIVLFAPFGHVDPVTSYHILTALTVAALLAALALVTWQLRLPVWAAAVVALMMAVSTPFMGTIGLGQIYGGLTLALAVAWVAARRGAMVWSGVFLGLVIAVKPTLVPLLLLPIAQRRWPTLYSTLATGIAGSLVGLLVAGPHATLDWLNLTRQQPVPDYFENASLPGFVVRLGGPSWLGFPLGAAVLAITYVRVRKDSDLALWAMTAATLLFSPIAWENYLMLLYPGILVLLHQRRYTTSALMLVVPTITMEWVTLWVGKSPLVQHLAVSYFFYMLLIYWLGLMPTTAQTEPTSAERGSAKPSPTVSGANATIV